MSRWADIRPLAEAGWFIFVSIAPMIGPVRLPDDFLALGQRTWVHRRRRTRVLARTPRYMEPEWARAVRNQCAEAGIPFFMKQMAKGAPIPPDLQITTVSGRCSSASLKSVLCRPSYTVEVALLLVLIQVLRSLNLCHP